MEENLCNFCFDKKSKVFNACPHCFIKCCKACKNKVNIYIKKEGICSHCRQPNDLLISYSREGKNNDIENNISNDSSNPPLIDQPQNLYMNDTKFILKTCFLSLFISFYIILILCALDIIKNWAYNLFWITYITNAVNIILCVNIIYNLIEKQNIYIFNLVYSILIFCVMTMLHREGYGNFKYLILIFSFILLTLFSIIIIFFNPTDHYRINTSDIEIVETNEDF